MGLTILLITLIVLACLFVVFLGIQAKRIVNCYEDSVKYSDADLNKPTFIRINDDKDLDYIFNTNDISLISAANRTDGKYIIRIFIKDSEESSFTFEYDDKLIRDQLYDALSDYNVWDKLKSNE